MMNSIQSNNLLERGVTRAAIIGGGVIGASWAALFLANGISVTVNDPDPDIVDKVKAVIEGAAPALAALGYCVDHLTANLTFEADLASAVKAADLVQECGPERVDFKRALWQRIEHAAPEHAVLISSSSSIPASAQNRDMAAPGRLMIGHPFNPPHLMPLVEVVPTSKTPPELVTRAAAFYRAVGKVPLELKKELPGFVANRLQAAILQESIYLVLEGVVSIRDLDDIVTNSLGIRWATNGPFLSFHLGGGMGGLAHFVEHLGKGPMEGLWKTLGKVSFDDPTCKLLIEQAQQFYGSQSINELADIRDQKEVAIVNALAAAGHGASA